MMAATFDQQVAAELATRYRGVDPVKAWRDAQAVIESAIANQPRSLQTAIGPSELGNPCQHCLAARLAGWPQDDDDRHWLPYIGTAMHAQLEQVFVAEQCRALAAGEPDRYLVECRVKVGELAGVEVWGSTDLVDLAAGITLDWKLVGTTTLRAAKGGPSPQYRAQAHLYAKGWNDAGYRIPHVGIIYLPRAAVSLDSAVFWAEPYRPELATEVLHRADQVLANLRALETISTQARDSWITSLPRDPHCFDCARYPDAPARQPVRRGAFADLPVDDWAARRDEARRRLREAEEEQRRDQSRAELARLVEQRQRELEDIERLMRPGNTASAAHRGSASHRPI